MNNKRTPEKSIEVRRQLGVAVGYSNLLCKDTPCGEYESREDIQQKIIDCCKEVLSIMSKDD